jgi:hypothetical protein
MTIIIISEAIVKFIIISSYINSLLTIVGEWKSPNFPSTTRMALHKNSRSKNNADAHSFQAFRGTYSLANSGREISARPCVHQIKHETNVVNLKFSSYT